MHGVIMLIQLNVVFKHTGHWYTVEPPNNGHIGGESLVRCREVVLISEVR